MCALFGWLDYKGIVKHKTLRKLTQALANAAEERGTDASGISYVKNNSITIFKRPKPAHRVHFSPPEGTQAVMGHTRFTTQGSEKRNYNNHPFIGHANHDFAFAHNGVLYNDEALRKEKQLPDTPIETDSYVAVQLIEQQGQLNFNSLKTMAEDVQGNFTFTVLDEENSLYFIKGSNPLYLIHMESLGLYIYASTETIMKTALKNIDMSKIKYNRIPAVEGDMIRINRMGEIARFQFSPSLPLGHREWYDEYSYYTLHEQLLMDYCNSFNIDEEEIELLLDYGYTADEIEDMLLDYDTLRATINAIRYDEDMLLNDSDDDCCDICDMLMDRRRC